MQLQEMPVPSMVLPLKAETAETERKDNLERIIVIRFVRVVASRRRMVETEALPDYPEQVQIMAHPDFPEEQGDAGEMIAVHKWVLMEVEVMDLHLVVVATLVHGLPP